jgi:hypothetical protein
MQWSETGSIHYSKKIIDHEEIINYPKSLFNKSDTRYDAAVIDPSLEILPHTN